MTRALPGPPPEPLDDLDLLIKALNEYKRLADQALKSKNGPKHAKYVKKYNNLLALIRDEYPHQKRV